MSELLELLKKATEILEKRESEACSIKNTERSLAEYQPGETINIGAYDYVVLKQDIENGHTHVMSASEVFKNHEFGSSRDFNESYILDRIKSEVLNDITSAVGEENIIEHTVSLESVDKQNEFGTWTGKVRIMTFDEAREYNDIIAERDYGWLWTLTPWSSSERGWSKAMAVVSPSGYIGNYCCINCIGACPFCILKSSIML